MNIELFSYSVDLLVVILWQYNEAFRIQSLLTQKQEWYTVNQTQFWSDFYTDIFDLQTANDFGLSVWSIILDLPLQINPTPDSPTKPLFGFGTFYKNFEWGNFTSSDGSFSLSTEEKRLILKLRYFTLSFRPTIPQINTFLKFLWGNQGSVYVLDGLNMTMQYVFTFNPGERLLYILEKYNLLPRPQGVEITIIVLTRILFGFGNFYQNFKNGTFAEGT